MDLPTVSLLGDVRSAPARPRHRSSTHLRGAKLVAAGALTVLVGLGSYATTYRTLVLVSSPAPANRSVVHEPSGGATTATVPVTATPAPPQP